MINIFIIIVTINAKIVVIIITEKEKVSNPSDWTTKSLNVEKRENADWMKKGLNGRVIEDFQKLKKEE